MVLVPVTLPSGSPCAILPNSLAEDLFQITVLLAAHELAVVEVLSSVIVLDELDAFALFLLSELHVSLMW